MYNTFLNDNPDRINILSAPQLSYVQGCYRQELKKIQQYYLNTNRFVDTEHVLVRLLATFDAMYDDDLARFMSSIYIERDQIERVFQFCSPTNPRPVLYKGMFFNKDTSDLFLSVVDYFDTIGTEPRALTPLRFLSHPFTDMNAAMPDGKYRSMLKESGLSIVAIDIPQLAYVFHDWLKNGDIESGKKQRHFAHFIYVHILPRMLPSQLDVAYFNRFSTKYRGGQVSDGYQVHLFGVVDYTTILDNVIDYQISKINDTHPIYANLINGLPGLIGDRYVTSVRIPDGLVNRNNQWAILMARIEIYILIMTMCITTGKPGDIQLIKNQLRLLARALDRDQSSVTLSLPYQAQERMNRLRFLAS